jgi:hypothetical protein
MAQMDFMKATSGVSETELDMNRRNHLAARGKVRRVLSTILGYHGGASPMGTPRRSIDRELQQYSPSND